MSSREEICNFKSIEEYLESMGNENEWDDPRDYPIYENSKLVYNNSYVRK